MYPALMLYFTLASSKRKNRVFDEISFKFRQMFAKSNWIENINEPCASEKSNGKVEFMQEIRCSCNKSNVLFDVIFPFAV